MEDVLRIALFVEEVLERLDVRHVVGGSLASSLHGIPRATQDIDYLDRVAALLGVTDLLERAVEIGGGGEAR